MSKIGIDISVWNTIGNYDDVVNNIDFAILRVGYGVQYLPNQQKDKKFNEFYDNLKGRVPLGAYYYSYASNYDQGWQEAENCLNYIEGRTFELPIYYDLEEQKNTAEAGQGFVDRMREAGVPVGIYASTSFYQNKGLACIDADSVWIAQYGSNTGSIPSKKPPIPYDIWQYTSKGYVEGVLGDVDMNIKDDDTPTPGPTPTPPPEFDPVVLDYQQSWNKTYGSTYGYIKEDGLYGSQTEWSKRKVYLKYGMKNNLIGWCQCRLRYHKGYDLGTSGINQDGVDDCFR
jgi:GH25 family lysozyme M1 (1,4-beta-N-acetylmuramidase)